MSTVTDNDLKELKELKDLINSKFEQINEKIDSKFEQVDNKLNDMRVDIATLKEGQKSIDKRLDNLEFTNRGVFISVVSGLLIATVILIVKFLAPPIG